MALTLLGGLVTKHLNGVWEQNATTCLMSTETLCVSENGAMCMAHRGSEQASTMLDWVEPTVKTTELVLAMHFF